MLLDPLGKKDVAVALDASLEQRSDGVRPVGLDRSEREQQWSPRVR
jgi:hypothetical protein